MLASSTEAAMSLLLCCPKARGWSVYGMARITYTIKKIERKITIRIEFIITVDMNNDI